MPRRDNYAQAAREARARFLTYDQEEILKKCPVRADGDFLCLPVLARLHRISRSTGHIECLDGDIWLPADDFATTLTLFDYLCDSHPVRCLSGREMTTAFFGNHFHTPLLETASPLERRIDRSPGAFRRACSRLQGEEIPGGDLSFRIFLFPDLPVTLRFWHSDEDFPPSLRFFWDENTNRFIRYETMHYALGLIQSRLTHLLQN